MAIAIIGCGAVGSAITEQLVKRDVVDKIKLIDTDIKKMDRVLQNLKATNGKLFYSSFQLNATKTNDIMDELKDMDLVINAASPICNIPIMKACLKSNTNYIDLASDPFEYPDIKGTSFNDQLKLHNDFLKKEILAVTNTGFSPGFTDILSKYITSKNSLDSIEYIKIYFGEKIEASKFVVSWSPYIFLLESISPPTVYKNNKIITIDSEQSYRKVRLPPPIGKIKLTIFSGHPELMTIPKYIDIPIDYIEISGGYKLNNMEFNDILIKALREKVGESTFFNGDIFEILSTSFENPDKFIDNYKNGIIKNEFSACVFKLRGKKQNKTLEFQATIKHNLKEVFKTFSSGSVSSFMVSFVPVVIAEKIILKEITEKGVIAPAGLNNASEIIEECKNMGLNIRESVEWH